MNWKKRDDGLPANPILRWLAQDYLKSQQRGIEYKLARRGKPDGSPRFEDPAMNALSERFDFTLKDLQANRKGSLSDRQIERYRLWASKTPRAAVKVGAAIGVGGTLMLWYLLGELDAALAFGAMCFGTSLVYGVCLRWFLYQRHIRMGKVKSVTGRISHHAGRSGTRATSVHSGRYGRGRNWVAEPGDRAMFATMPYVTVHYLQGMGTTMVHSIEPAEPPAGS